MDGDNFRSLVGPALLRDLKLDDFVVKTPQEYIELAVKLGTGSRIQGIGQAGAVCAGNGEGAAIPGFQGIWSTGWDGAVAGMGRLL